MSQIDSLVDGLDNAIDGSVMTDKIDGETYVFVYPSDTDSTEKLAERLPEEYSLRYVERHSDLGSYVAFRPTSSLI